MHPPHPRFIQIETTIVCNAECPFCLTPQVTRRPKQMEDGVWRKIVDETRGLGITYRPFLQNEPLVDRRLPEIVQYIKEDSTARVEINTNGELLPEERARALLGAGCDLIKFSIDGFSEETAGKVRRISYQRVVENATRFCRLVREERWPVEVQVRMIDMEMNRHEQDDFLRYWRAQGAQALVVPLYRWPWSGQEDCVRLPCPKIIEEMFFYVDGRATLCCWDGAERGVIGDVKEQSVLAIWQGETNRRYRDLLSRGERDKILLCSRCDGFATYDFASDPRLAWLREDFRPTL